MECSYDGGDCCGPNANTQYCSVCSCIDPNEGNSTSTMGTTTQGTTSGMTSANPTTAGGCNTGWIGDAYCDDINNNMDCSYDGGDCCGCNVNTQYCSVCGCLDPNGSGTTCPQTTTISTLSTTHGPGNYALALKLLSPLEIIGVICFYFLF